MPSVPLLNSDIDLSTFVLLGILLLLGKQLVRRKPTLKDCGKRIASGLFFVFVAILVVERQPADAAAWIAILVRSLIFAGIALGGMWLLLPVVLFVYQNTFGLLFQVLNARTKAIERRAREKQDRLNRQLALIQEEERKKQAAIRLAEFERRQAIEQQQRFRDEEQRTRQERELEFYALRDDMVELFLQHHALLEQELSVAAIVDDFDRQRSCIQESWQTFLRFANSWQYRILIGAARNNLLLDYSKAEPAVGPVFPRDQFQRLLDEALSRDEGRHQVDEGLERLSTLHDKLADVFDRRSVAWQAQSDAKRAVTYADTFGEFDDAAQEDPFENDDRLTYRGDVG